MRRIAIIVPATISRENTATYIPAHVDLIRRLSERHELHVYSTRKRDQEHAPTSCGRATVTYVAARFDDAPWRQLRAIARAVGADHRRKPFEALHGFRGVLSGTCAVLLAKRWRLPSIVSLQGGEAAALPEIGYGNLRAQPLRGITLWTCRQANILTFLTRFQRQALASEGVARADGLVIPYAAHEQFSAIWAEKDLRPPYRFLHVGQVSPVKDQRTLLNAFRRISERVDARLEIVGDDLLQGEMQQLTERLGMARQVAFRGFVPHDQLPPYFARAHCMLHTSLYEGEGVVIAEAAAAGVVVCGTAVGLIADLGREGAVTAAVRDDSSLADGVLSLLGNPERYAQLRETAKRWASFHTPAWSAGEFSELYDRLPLR